LSEPSRDTSFAIAAAQHVLKEATLPHESHRDSGRPTDQLGHALPDRVVAGPANPGRLLWSADKSTNVNVDLASQGSAQGVISLCERDGIGKWSLLNVITAFHRIAKAHDGNRLRNHRCVSELQVRMIDDVDHCSAQQLANSAWACARLGFRDPPLIASIASASITIMHEFKAQELGNTAWALSRLSVFHCPLLASISAAARRPCCAGQDQAGQTQSLSNTAWAFAKLVFLDVPLCAALSAAALHTMKDFRL